MPNAPPERIFVSSARVSDAEIGESKRSGCDEFMPKPVQVEALLAQMERHLGLEWHRGGRAKQARSSRESGRLRQRGPWCLPL
jgi:hypothetical protein